MSYSLSKSGQFKYDFCENSIQKKICMYLKFLEIFVKLAESFLAYVEQEINKINAACVFFQAIRSIVSDWATYGPTATDCLIIRLYIVWNAAIALCGFVQ